MAERAQPLAGAQEKRVEDPELREKIREAFRATLVQTLSGEKPDSIKEFICRMPRADEPMALEILPVPPTGTVPQAAASPSEMVPTALLGVPTVSVPESSNPKHSADSSPEPPAVPTVSSSWARPVSAVVSPPPNPGLLAHPLPSASTGFANLEVIPVLNNPYRKPSKSRITDLLPYSGTFFGTLDNRSALVLPEEVRQQLGKAQTLLLTPGPDRCLWLTSTRRRGLVLAHLDHSGPGGPEAQKTRRLFFAQTEKVTLQPDGRLVLPSRLVDYACLGCELTLIGMDDYFEIWDSLRWQQYSRSQAGPAKAAPQKKTETARWSRP
jgi:MraZ protein